MKKKLIIIGSVIGVLILCLVLLVPFVLNTKLSKNRPGTDSTLDNDNVPSEKAEVSFDEVIEKYQKYLSYPKGSARLLDLNISVGDYCLGADECYYRYTYQDLNNDGIDELIIGSGTNELYTYIVDIYYFDGSVKDLFHKLETAGFWGRNQLTILEDGQFSVYGSSGANSGSETYYGNVKSPKDKVSSWEDFGKILEYDFDYEQKKYTKYDKNQNEQTISKKEFDNLVSSLGKSVDTSNWEWKTITKDPSITADEFKVYDYFYLVDKDKFVKGISLGGSTVKGNQRIMRTSLATVYPKLFEVAKETAYDMTFSVNTGVQEIDISTYRYPMYYQYQDTGNIEFFFTISDIYYDSDDDGYVDWKGQGYFVAPIDEYENKYGKLTN